MRKTAGGLIELLLAFLILSVVVAFAMQTTLLQMKSQETKNVKSGTASSTQEVKSAVSITQVENVVNKIELAKDLKLKEEKKVIDNWLR